MTEILLTIFFISVLLIFLGSGIWVAISMVGVSSIGMMLFTTRPVGDAMATTIWGASSSWTLTAVKVHEDEAPQIVVAIASPTGLVVNSIIPIDETPTMLIATQIPEPKNIKRTLMKNIVSKISVIFFCLYFQN